MNDIKNALKYGTKVKIDDKTVEYNYKNIYVRASTDEKNMGSIQTAFPKTR